MANLQIFDTAISKANDLARAGALAIPSGYNPTAAIRAAQIILSEATDKNGTPVLQSCSQQSVYMAMLRMVTQGLDPLRAQCYFVAYGGKLECQRSYFGSISLARRYGMKSVEAAAIYEGDEVKITMNPDGSRKIEVISSFTNQKIEKLIGAYAIVTMSDGYVHSEIMTMQQIRQSWMKSKNYGKGPQAEFPDEMAKRTVTQRALKWIVNTYITDDDAPMEELPAIEDSSNVIVIDTETETEPEQKPEQNPNDHVS